MECHILSFIAIYPACCSTNFLLLFVPRQHQINVFFFRYCHIPFSSRANNVRFSKVEGTLMRGQRYSGISFVYIDWGWTSYIPEMSALRNIFPNFVGLILSNSKLKYVERSKLTNISQLHFLFLNGNEIETFNEDVLYDLPHLEQLSFAQNRIRILPYKLLSNQLKLQDLWLEGNQIEIIPAHFFKNNKELLFLSLKGNRLTKIYEDFNMLPKLRYNDLQGNNCIDKSMCGWCEFRSRDEIQTALELTCK